MSHRTGQAAAGHRGGEGHTRRRGEEGVTLARVISGEHALPVLNGYVLLSKERLCRHVLVCGATGSGKTETVLRLAWCVAKSTEAPVFYLDGKGDREAAERFVALMADAGRQTRVFPGEPLDGWRGEAHELQGRLMEIVDYADEGPAAWYRDLARVVIGLACEHPQGPPRSSRELLVRLDLQALKQAHGETADLLALSTQHVSQVRLRFSAFFAQTRGALDGGWAWEETNAAYLLLESLRLREETACLTRFLLEDFAHYFSSRKPRAQMALLVVDEYSALADAAAMAQRVEQARGFQTAMVLVPQVVAGMGEESEAQRILGSVETVICHRVNTPEEIIALAGTRCAPRYSTRYTQAGVTGEGSIQRLQEPKIDANHVRALPTGEAYVIRHGQAMRAQILRAPQPAGELSQAHEARGAGPDAPPSEDRPARDGSAQAPASGKAAAAKAASPAENLKF